MTTRTGASSCVPHPTRDIVFFMLGECSANFPSATVGVFAKNGTELVTFASIGGPNGFNCYKTLKVCGDLVFVLNGGSGDFLNLFFVDVNEQESSWKEKHPPLPRGGKCLHVDKYSFLFCASQI
jgi:hypothetical protein